MKTISITRAEKIAKNINAMDTNFQRINDGRSWRFWNDLNGKLRNILQTLNDADLEILKPLLNKDEAQFFNLI